MIGFMMAFLYLGLRGFGRLTQAELWAEDGVTMLRDTLVHGWASVLYPTDATPQVFQRFAELAVFALFPIELLPTGIAVTALTVNAMALGFFSRKTYRWLIPNDIERLFVILALCSLPGLTEMLANLANTNWFFFFVCCLIFLKDPKETITASEHVLLIISLVSLGTGVLLFPLWIWRIYTRREKWPRSEWFSGALLILHVILLRSLKSKVFFILPTDGLFVWVKIYWRILVESFFLQPWFGDQATIFSFGPGGRLYNNLLSALSVLFFLLLLWKNRKMRRALPCFTFFLSLSLWPVLCWIGRPGSIITFKTDTPSPWYFSHRYSFPTAFMALFVWSCLLQEIKVPSRLPKWFPCAIFCALFVFHSFGRWPIPAYGITNRWSVAAPKLATALTAGCPHKVDIPVYPDRLDFTYEVPLEHKGVECFK